MAGKKGDGLGAADAGFAQNTYNDWVNDAEEFHPIGEKAVRNVSLPTRNLEGQKNSKVGQTIMEAGNTSDGLGEYEGKPNRVEEVQNAYVNGKLTVNSNSDSSLVQKALIAYKADPQKAKTDWVADVRAGKVNADLVAMGAVILDNINTDLNVSGEEYVDILIDYAKLGSTAGQAMQAQRIYKMLSPEGKLYAIKKAIDGLGAETGTQIKMDTTLVDEFLKANSDEARRNVEDKIYQDIADKLPSSFKEKWTALRYMNMLGNFKTQVRNIIGNSTMTAMKAIKDEIATGIETFIAKSNPDFERTKSARVGKAWMEAASADFDSVREAAMGNGKYNDYSRYGVEQEIQDRRTIFKANGTWGTNENSNGVSKLARKGADTLYRGAEAYRKATNWATSYGDEVFIKHHYARALAGYLKANGITIEQFQSGNVDQQLLDRATNYAIKEAQEATFHDNNAFSNWVSKLGRRSDTLKIAKIVGEGIAPFRKTPANVLVRAYEYSPAGLLDTLRIAAKAKKGNATASDIINNAARGLTGTGIMALGIALSASGWLRAVGDDDDKDIDALMNRQDYSLVIPGVESYTIDWLTPATLPLFLGVNAFDIFTDEELSFADVEDVFSQFAEPILETSMLSGIDDAISSVKYSDNHILQMAATFGLSYVTQGLNNTLLGQFEQIGQENRMTTYTTPDSNIPTWLQRIIGKASAKTPGWDYQQTEYLDEFGNTESNGSLAWRIIENLISPGYWNQSHEGEKVYDYLQTIHDETGTDYYPSASTISSITTGGTKYTLSQEDKEQYQKTQGETYIDAVGLVLEAVENGKISHDRQAEMLSDIKSYAAGTAKEEYLQSQGVDYSLSSNTWMKAIDALEEADISVTTYYEYDARVSNVEYGKGTDGAKREAILKIIDSLDLTEKQKDYLYYLNKYSESTINDAPWHKSDTKSTKSFWDYFN